MTEEGVVRRVPGRVDPYAVLSVMRRGGGDPTWLDVRGGLAKVWVTPLGPAVAAFVRGVDEVVVTAWGPGAPWLLEAAPRMVGARDDPTGFEPRHRAVSEAVARCPGWRVPATGLVLEALVPAVLEQRVTGVEGFSAYQALVRRFGAPAPGPFGLRVAPDARGWARIPSWEYTRAGVDAGRAAAVVRAAGYAGRLEECADLPLPRARARLAALPGVGGWTVAEVAHRVLGDADAVSFGDYHVARDIGWALTGRETDDAGLAELLAPYAGHRYRVQRLLELAGARRPRRGARRSLPTHLPGPWHSGR